MAIHKGDIGTKISLDAGIDVTGATEVEIHYKKPSGATGIWAAKKDDEDKNDIYYITKAGDLDEYSIWILQSFVKFNNGEWRGKKVEMEVENILIETVEE